jgi:3-phenylpropionate/trans-cinnamate dioxygenase ferredoxin reductase component
MMTTRSVTIAKTADIKPDELAAFEVRGSVIAIAHGVEHWQNAMQQGAAATKSMLGKAKPYDAVHWFWSDQYDVNLQYAGFHQEWNRVVVRGNLDARNFIAFSLSHGRIDAVIALNRGKDVRRVMPLIKARATVGPRQIGDEGVDLRSLTESRLSGAHI